MRHAIANGILLTLILFEVWVASCIYVYGVIPGRISSLPEFLADLVALAGVACLATYNLIHYKRR